MDLTLEGTKTLKGSSYFESSKNSGKNVHRHFCFKCMLKIGDTDQIYFKYFFAYRFNFYGELIERPFLPKFHFEYKVLKNHNEKFSLRTLLLVEAKNLQISKFLFFFL